MFNISIKKHKKDFQFASPLIKGVVVKIIQKMYVSRIRLNQVQNTCKLSESCKGSIHDHVSLGNENVFLLG